MIEWPIWRLVLIEKCATLEEIERCWSIDDVALANEALDVIHEMKERVEQEAMRKAKAGKPW